MAIQDIWLRNLKALVKQEGGDRKGWRSVASASGLSEEYIYQLDQGKLKKNGNPREVGKIAAQKIAKAFADGRPESWFDYEASEHAQSKKGRSPTSSAPNRAMESVPSYIGSLDELMAELPQDVVLRATVYSLAARPILDALSKSAQATSTPTPSTAAEKPGESPLEAPGDGKTPLPPRTDPHAQ